MNVPMSWPHQPLDRRWEGRGVRQLGVVSEEGNTQPLGQHDV